MNTNWKKQFTIIYVGQASSLLGSAVRTNKPLMAIFFPMILMNIIFMPLGTLFPLLVRTHFMGDAIHNSIVEFVFAGGLLVSSAVIGVWGGMKKRFLMVTFGIVLLGVASIISGALPPSGFEYLLYAAFLWAFPGHL